MRLSPQKLTPPIDYRLSLNLELKREADVRVSSSIYMYLKLNCFSVGTVTLQHPTNYSRQEPPLAPNLLLHTMCHACYEWAFTSVVRCVVGLQAASGCYVSLFGNIGRVCSNQGYFNFKTGVNS